MCVFLHRQGSRTGAFDQSPIVQQVTFVNMPNRNALSSFKALNKGFNKNALIYFYTKL